MSTSFHLWISGCQMNNSDARWLADVLSGAGMTRAERFEDADVAILYTCSVRQSAENRVHGQLGHLKSLKAKRPGMVLCVTGCMAGADQAALRKRYPFVDHFVAPTEIDTLPEKLLSSDLAASCVPDPIAYGTTVPVSAGLTVIRGCDKYCSYCIVPYRRGKQVSRSENEILDEARALVSRGAKEIVLLGQTVDAWGRDLEPAQPFAGLLKSMSNLPGLVRLRFLTSHPDDFTPDIVQAMADLPQLCEELNLPIQAGDDEILRRMARRYTVKEYLALIRQLRDAVPGLALSTDVIVGFPGETREQYENTLSVLREVEFDIVHVAAYSPREGTAAARKLEDDVLVEEKKRRLHEVEAVQTEIATRKNAAQIGATVQVLVEGRQKGKWSGRTRTNKLVFFNDPRDLTGALVDVRITDSGPWSLRGHLAD